MKLLFCFLLLCLCTHKLNAQTELFRKLDKAKGYNEFILGNKMPDSICELEDYKNHIPYLYLFTPKSPSLFFGLPIEHVLYHGDKTGKLELISFDLGIDSLYEANLNKLYSLFGLPNATVISHKVELIDSASYKTEFNNNAGIKYMKWIGKYIVMEVHHIFNFDKKISKSEVIMRFFGGKMDRLSRRYNKPHLNWVTID